MKQSARILRVAPETSSLRERTTEALRNAILSLHFAPGEKLVERRLCDETGVSRTCVREALRHLEAEGLVQRVPNRGMFVARLTVDEARQIYEVRAALEASMVRSFVERASDSQVKSLEKALQRVATAAFKPNVVAYSNTLVELTNVILAGADNELASQVLGRLRARMTYLRVITARAASREQREGTIAALTAVFEAIAARDADTAERLLKAYVARSASFALRLLKEIEVDEGAGERRAQGRGA